MKSKMRGNWGEGVSVIGPGNWGNSLAAAIEKSEIQLREVVVRGRRKVLDGKSVHAGQANYDATVLWICVPDGAIAEAVEQILERRPDLRGQMVVHSSGALTSEVLESARRAGAEVASVAPVMSFPSRDVAPLEGVLFAVEAARESYKKLARMVRVLGGRPFRIEARKKALYHAAATMASPLLVSSLSAAVVTARQAGMNEYTAREVVRVLAQATAANFFSRGAEASFSGPFARGDDGTIELHLRALGEHPILERIYCALAANAVVSLPVRNRGKIARLLARDMT